MGKYSGKMDVKTVNNQGKSIVVKDVPYKLIGRKPAVEPCDVCVRLPQRPKEVCPFCRRKRWAKLVKTLPTQSKLLFGR